MWAGSEVGGEGEQVWCRRFSAVGETMAGAHNGLLAQWAGPCTLSRRVVRDDRFKIVRRATAEESFDLAFGPLATHWQALVFDP